MTDPRKAIVRELAMEHGNVTGHGIYMDDAQVHAFGLACFAAGAREQREKDAKIAESTYGWLVHQQACATFSGGYCNCDTLTLATPGSNRAGGSDSEGIAMAELTGKEAACREIAERLAELASSKLLFNTHIPPEKWHFVILANGEFESIIREAYDAGAKAQREQDAQIAEPKRKHCKCDQCQTRVSVATAIRQGRQ